MKKRTRREKRMYEEKNEKKIEKRQIQFYDILIQCSAKILILTFTLIAVCVKVW